MRIHNKFTIFLVYTFLCYKKCLVYSRPEVLLPPKPHVNLNSNDYEYQSLLEKYNPNNPNTELISKLVEVTFSNDLRSEHKVNDTRFYYVEDHPRSFYYRFNFKRVCVELKYAGKLVWKEGPEYENETPNEIFIEKQQRRINLDFPSFFLTYQYKDNKWVLKNFNRKSVYATELTIFTSDDEYGTNIKTNDINKYNVYKYDYVVHYEFKKDTYCTEFRCKNKRVWKYNPDNPGKGFPKSVYLHTDFGLIFVDFYEVSSIYRCAGNTCRFLADRNMKGFSYSSVKLMTEDPEIPKNLKENDNTQYRKKSLGYAQIYNMKEGAKCKEVKYDDYVLWYYGYKSGKEYPKAVFVNFFFKMIVISFSKFNLVYMYLDRWRYVSKSYPEPFTENEVSIFTQNELNKTQWDFNDKSKYDVTKYPHGYALMFNFKPNAKCVEVKFKNKSIWKHNSRKLGVYYPNLIYLNRDLKMILVSSPKFFNIYVKLDKWREVLSSREKDILEPPEINEENPDDVRIPNEDTVIEEPKLTPATEKPSRFETDSSSSDSESSDESEEEESESESESESSPSETESSSSSSSESSSGEDSADEQVRFKNKRAKRRTKRSKDSSRSINDKQIAKEKNKKNLKEQYDNEEQNVPLKPEDAPKLVKIPGNIDDEESETSEKTTKKEAKASTVLNEPRRKIITTTFVVIILSLVLVLAGVGVAIYLKKRKPNASNPLLPTQLEV